MRLAQLPGPTQGPAGPLQGSEIRSGEARPPGGAPPRPPAPATLLGYSLVQPRPTAFQSTKQVAFGSVALHPP